jgi:hypothetical protein
VVYPALIKRFFRTPGPQMKWIRRICAYTTSTGEMSVSVSFSSADPAFARQKAVTRGRVLNETTARDVRLRSSCAAALPKLGLVPHFGFLDRMSLSKFGVGLGHGHQLLVMLVKYINLVFSKVLDIDEPITCSL